MTPIANYKERYLINENGAVLNLADNALLSPSKNANGYLKVSLANGNSTSTDFTLHRLVALHFIPNPYQYPQVNHINGDKTNNHTSNLEWCSAQQNIQHAFKTGLRPGYMSADDKELYLQDVLAGTQVKDIAKLIDRRPETLHKMLRETAKRLGLSEEWQLQMKENRKNAAIRNLEKINN